ncbi:PH domain-containing protein [Streptomyces sp. NPDC052496]|uniref:PH domain-containing protein n=1 Tax=Streptomyces sp. NPDC052496 TaxID=3154951 RepID=UPI0034356B09
METITYRPASRKWQWGALAVFVLTVVIPAGVVTLGMGWQEFVRRYSADDSGSSLSETTIALLVFGLSALALSYCCAMRTYVGAAGIRVRTPLRRRSVAWGDITDIGVRRYDPSFFGRRGTATYRIRLLLASGEGLFLPAPVTEEFDSEMEAAKGEIIRRWKAATGTPAETGTPAATAVTGTTAATSAAEPPA